MFRVALVNMPWITAKRGSMALGILERVLHRHHIPAESFYLNIRLAASMNLRIYETISDAPLIGEWLFSQHLFGPYGSGELDNSAAAVIGRDGPEVLDLGRGRRVGYDRIVRDILPPFIDDCLERVPWSDFSVVGFTSVFTQHVSSLLLAKRIKERHPSTTIVFGGANVADVMGLETLRAFPWVDYVVDGEAEESFPQLLRHIHSGRPYDPVPGVSCRRDDRVIPAREQPPLVDMRQVPIPDYAAYYRELQEAGLAERVRPQIQFESARGCYWGEKAQCAFCGMNGRRMTFRTKPGRQVARELRVQARRHHTLDFEAVDNAFAPSFFDELVPRLDCRRDGLKIFYEARGLMSRQQIRRLRDAGICSLQIGIESLHPDLLRRLRKGATVIQNLQTLKWCATFGVSVSWNFLFGIPGETAAHYREMMDLLPSLTHLDPPQVVARVILQRFSPYFADPERWGIAGFSPKRLYTHIYPENRINLRDLAYHFSFTLREEGENPANYIGPVARAIQRWKDTALLRFIHFTFRKGPGFVLLKDNRPLGQPPDSEERTAVLDGLSGRVFEFCDSIRTLSEIVAFAAAGNGGADTAARVRDVLAELVGRNYMYTEHNRYLSLAVPEFPAP